MAQIKGKDTKAEILLRKLLFSRGFRFRTNDKRLTGKPDIVFAGKRVCVFVDGDWWHGRNYEKESAKYPLFWQEKIKKNMARDVAVNEQLSLDRWMVLRFWQKDIEKDLERIANSIIFILNRPNG